MNALDLIKTDHDRLKDLMEQAEKTGEPAERARLLHEMRAELMAHERMEEDIFYPALRSNAKAKAIVLEGYEEHHVIDLILDEILDLPEDSEQWPAKFKVLKENIEHHIEEEEGEMFRRARAAMPKETLDDLGVKMQAQKEAATA